MLTKYRLINLAGAEMLDTHAGRRRLDQIDDALAEQLHARGSRYVEKLPDPAPSTPPLAGIDVAQSPPEPPKSSRRKSSKAK